MHPHKKRMIVMFSILALLVIGVFAADAYFKNQEEQGLFGFVSFSHGNVRIGACEVVISADGEVESATLHVRNSGGAIGTGGSWVVSSSASSAKYKITYTKGMKKAQEEAATTESFAFVTTLQDLDFAARDLMELFPRAELQLRFSPKSGQSPMPAGYDGYYQYSFSDGLAPITANQYWGGDELTVTVGDKIYMVIFQNNPLDN